MFPVLSTLLTFIFPELVQYTYLTSKFLLQKWFTQIHEHLCYGIGVHQMGRYDVARECVLQRNKTLLM